MRKLRRFLSTLVGLRSGPAANGSTAIILIENGWRETMAMAAWIPLWVITTAIVLVIGQIIADRNVRLQILPIAGAPAFISVVGFILHMIRAATALSVGRRLVFEKRPGGADARAISRLTAPTPWLLVPQVVVGIALSIFIANGLASAP